MEGGIHTRRLLLSFIWSKGRGRDAYSHTLLPGAWEHVAGPGSRETERVSTYMDAMQREIVKLAAPLREGRLGTIRKSLSSLLTSEAKHVCVLSDHVTMKRLTGFGGEGFHKRASDVKCPTNRESYSTRQQPWQRQTSDEQHNKTIPMAWGYFLQCSCFGTLVTPLSPLRFDIDGGERRLIRRSRHRPAAKQGQGWGLFLKTGFWMVIGRTSVCRCAGKPCIEQSA
ncbi:hypothetical protein HDV62DRAFT_343142 [Trichoderma sp. SZMC 28011]